MRQRFAVALFFLLVELVANSGNESNQAFAATPKGKKTKLNLYLDVHNKVDGLTAEAVAAAHKKDLEVEGKYGVHYLRYWFDESTGKVFCLVEAPNAKAAEQVHKEAHGLVADEITAVKEGN